MQHRSGSTLKGCGHDLADDAQRHRVVHRAVRRGAAEAGGAAAGMATPREPGDDGPGRGLDRHQQRDLPGHGLAAARRARARGPVDARVVPRGLQPPVLGGHPGAAGRVQPPHSIPEVLPEAGTDLGAVPGAGLVGARFPVHAPPFARIPREAPGETRRGPRGHAEGLREIPADPDVGDEFRRRHALHGEQARGVPGRRTGTCCRHAGAAPSFVLSAMGGMLHAMLDVTIAYRGRPPSLWDLCCGRRGHGDRRYPQATDRRLDGGRRLCRERPGVPQPLQGLAGGRCGPRRTGCSTGCSPEEIAA